MTTRLTQQAWIERVTQRLWPYFRAVPERRSLLDQAFPDSENRVLGYIALEGTPYAFLESCLKELFKQRCDLPGNLLYAVARGVGANIQQTIDDLVDELHALCAEAPIALSSQSVTQPTLFLSYPEASTEMVASLRADLAASGHACETPHAPRENADHWLTELTERLNNAYAALLILGNERLDGWNELEVLAARNHQKQLFVLRIGDHDLPAYLPADVVLIDFRHGYNIGYQRLLQQLPYPPLPFTWPELRPRARELGYMKRLTLEELQHVARYTRLSGESSIQRTRGGRLTLQPVVARPEYTLRPWHDAHHTAVETRQFDNAVDELRTIRRAVLLGAPGSGKTTTLYRLASDLIETALEDARAAVPVLIRLGNWTSVDEPLDQFLQRSVGKLGEHLPQLLTEGRAVLLLDGLNEIPAGQHEEKYAVVDAFLAQYPELMAVVSCREEDYPAERALHLDRVTVAPLDPVRIYDFVCNYLDETNGDSLGNDLFWKLAGEKLAGWYAFFLKDVEDRLTEPFRMFWLADTLPDGILWGPHGGNDDWRDWLEMRARLARRREGLLFLASNPYMLYMLVEVYRERGHRLPANRGQLFDWFVQRLLVRERLFEMDPDAKAIRRLPTGEALLDGLTALALEMQTQRGRQGGETAAQTSLSRAEAAHFLTDEQFYQGVSATLLSLSNDVRFAHQLLQEYFAARGMRARTQGTVAGQPRLRAAEIWRPERWWQPTSWEVATILLAGLSSDDCSDVLDWVGDANPELAARCIVESGAFTPEEKKFELRDRWLPRLTDLQSDPQPQARAAVGRALGLVTLEDGTPLDNRPGVGVMVRDGVRLPDIEWGRVVPVGSYEVGGDSAAWNGPKAHTVPITAAYQLARYSVTYAQFQCFIDALDFADMRWWEGLPDEESDDFGMTYQLREISPQRFRFRNHPRDTVSWYQAIAFCRWLSDRLSYTVDLPTEIEWEVAARYPDGRLYPYGNAFDEKKANTREGNRIGRTTAVGIYPDGANAVLNLYDLSGNVWEWCRNKYKKPDDTTVDQSGVVRGGSWYDFQDHARTASRGSNRPYRRYGSVGFRVVRRLPSQNR